MIISFFQWGGGYRSKFRVVSVLVIGICDDSRVETHNGIRLEKCGIEHPIFSVTVTHV